MYVCCFFPLYYELFCLIGDVVGCALALGSYLVAGRMAKVLFDSGSTFSFVSKLFAAELDDVPAMLAFHLDGVTLQGKHSLVWRYLLSVDLELNGREFDASLILMGMNEYDVILGMDWLRQHSALINCARRRVFFRAAEAGSFFVQGVR